MRTEIATFVMLAASLGCTQCTPSTSSSVGNSVASPQLIQEPEFPTDITSQIRRCSWRVSQVFASGPANKRLHGDERESVRIVDADVKALSEALRVGQAGLHVLPNEHQQLATAYMQDCQLLVAAVGRYRESLYKERDIRAATPGHQNWILCYFDEPAVPETGVEQFQREQTMLVNCELRARTHSVHTIWETAERQKCRLPELLAFCTADDLLREELLDSIANLRLVD